MHAWAKCYCGGGWNRVFWALLIQEQHCLLAWEALKRRWLALRWTPVEAKALDPHDVEEKEEERRQRAGTRWWRKRRKI